MLPRFNLRGDLPSGTGCIEFFLTAQAEGNSQHEQTIVEEMFAEFQKNGFDCMYIGSMKLHIIR